MVFRQQTIEDGDLFRDRRSIHETRRWTRTAPGKRGRQGKKRAVSSDRPFVIRYWQTLLPGGFPRGIDPFSLLFGLEVLAGNLVDRLHRQPGLAAVVEAEQLDLDLVAFLDHVGGFLHAVW